MKFYLKITGLLVASEVGRIVYTHPAWLRAHDNRAGPGLASLVRARQLVDRSVLSSSTCRA